MAARISPVTRDGSSPGKSMEVPNMMERRLEQSGKVQPHQDGRHRIPPSFRDPGERAPESHDPAGNIQNADENGQKRNENSRNNTGYDAQGREKDAAEYHKPGAAEGADWGAACGEHLQGHDHHEKAKLGACGEGKHAEAHRNEKEAEKDHKDARERMTE